MKFTYTTTIISSVMAIASTDAASLRGSAPSNTMSQRALETSVVERGGFTFVGKPTPNCPFEAPAVGDVCVTPSQPLQCVYAVFPTGTPLQPTINNYWTCNCANDAFTCETRCAGSDCVGPDTVVQLEPQQRTLETSVVERNGFTFVGKSTPNCPFEAPVTGDACVTPPQPNWLQCRYAVFPTGAPLQPTVSNYWTCNCANNAFTCETRCDGIDCVGPDMNRPTTLVPSPRTDIVDTPDLPIENPSWCPTDTPLAQSTCEHAGMQCKYPTDDLKVQNCDCVFTSNEDNFWSCQAVM